MQVSRHWRMNPIRYRLEGVRYETGEVSLQDRPKPVDNPNNVLLEIKPEFMRELNPSVGIERK